MCDRLAGIPLLLVVLLGCGSRELPQEPSSPSGANMHRSESPAALEKAEAEAEIPNAREQVNPGPIEGVSPPLQITVVKKDRTGSSYALTLKISWPTASSILTDIYALVFYLPHAEPGQPTALAAHAAVQGDIGVGMANGDGKGFDGISFFSYGANIKDEDGKRKSGAFLWVKLPSTAAYDLTKQTQVRIPIGDWLVNGVSLEASGRCAVALGTLEFHGTKRIPTFRAISNTVEVNLSF